MDISADLTELGRTPVGRSRSWRSRCSLHGCCFACGACRATVEGCSAGVRPRLGPTENALLLACLQVAVVCAGAKSVLDIPRTLEFLETQVGQQQRHVYLKGRHSNAQGSSTVCSCPSSVHC